ACVEIAREVAGDNSRIVHERSYAIDALIELSDPSLETLAVSLENDTVNWPDPIARRTLVDLFPTYLPVSRLSRILGRVKEKSRSIGDLNYSLPRAIEIKELSPNYLDQLRQALTALLLEGITWEPDKFPHLRTKR